MSGFDNHFRHFAVSVERAIEQYGSIEEVGVVERQKEQIEGLVALEKKFRKTLIKHPWGPNVYRDFVRYITEERGNILAARPFFRERQDVFTNKIAKALKDRKQRALYPFNINFQFVKWVMDARDWKGNPIGGKVVALAGEIVRLRTEIVEMNLPLAISRARIFWSKTPRAHLSHMDLVQISCEGLMSAVDKFVLPYSKVFRSVAIGRIVGNFIEQYSETLLHFYPQDKRKIYRANKAMSRATMEAIAGVDFEKVAAAVNKDVKPSQKTDSTEISDLVAAASHVSTDSSPTNDEHGVAETMDRCEADPATRPDHRYEEMELNTEVQKAYAQLTVFERKLLRMKGVPVPMVYQCSEGHEACAISNAEEQKS